MDCTSPPSVQADMVERGQWDMILQSSKEGIAE